ncbi:hypothetical protein FB554_2402 [Barrientosiimonas humi]|uniref:Uncharacterized protein n=1 Tax=Barrientosiimonas humi TaxID=999931 RepID=A0A542XEI8_9MICO|nr:hypothetical protein [Barrientosiimonas humi]TQL34239.1 hypothetical protein FB554_2402 [Barrientosiimonas humi]CAG7574231.1 hypothetical protein BH39T_PBIAJDOK_02874 [Barrientosiimonas humi]
MSDPHAKLYQTKMTLLGVLFAVVGIVLVAFARWLQVVELGTWQWLQAVPFSELGATLFGIGVVGTAYDYYTARDAETNAKRRLRETLKEEAPVMRDAVIEGFAVKADDLKRVATPELLDDLATNAMALRLGDEQFAREIYADVRDQAIRAPERWHDVDVSIRLSTAVERSTTGAPLFDIAVEWTYTTVPGHNVRRFASVSDRDEYYELVSDVPSTSTWFMPSKSGIDASSRKSFELLEFSVDGVAQRIRRTARKTGQTYSVSLEPADGKPVRLRQVYRARGAATGHLLFVELPVPIRNISLSLDYTDTDIATMTVSDLVTSANRPRISRLPEQLPGKEVSIELPGWLLPRSGFTFVWTLTSELPPAARPTRDQDAA